MEQRSYHAVKRLIDDMPEVSPERLTIKYTNGIKSDIHSDIRNALEAWGGAGTWTINNFGNVFVGPHKWRSDVSFYCKRPPALQRCHPLGNVTRGIEPAGPPDLWLDVAFPKDRDEAIRKIIQEVQIHYPNCYCCGARRPNPAYSGHDVV